MANTYTKGNRMKIINRHKDVNLTLPLYIEQFYILFYCLRLYQPQTEHFFYNNFI